MNYRTALRRMVLALPVLLVILVVLLSGAAVAHAIGDFTAGRIISGVALAVGMAATADMILLVSLLGFKAMADVEVDRHKRRRRNAKKRRRRKRRERDEPV